MSEEKKLEKKKSKVSFYLPSQLARSLSTSGRCSICEHTFKFYKRKNYCKKCDRVVCDICSQTRTFLKDSPDLVRICDDCNQSRSEKKTNNHPYNPEIKIHSVVSADLDFDHTTAMKVPLGICSDEQLLAEVARRNIDLHQSITDALVKQLYTTDKILDDDLVLVTNKRSLKKYACKVLRIGNGFQSMSTEIEIMKRIRHRNIVSMHELFETPKCIWMILELSDGGDLRHFIANKTTEFDEVIIARQMKQIFSGVHYLHSSGVVHRDLKFENILIRGDIDKCEIKIADFSSSALIRLDENGYDSIDSQKRKKYINLNEICGTKEYLAPEVTKRQYGPQADLWAIGCILYEILTTTVAFPCLNDDNEETFYKRICNGKYDTNKPIFKIISPELKKILSCLLETDPLKRYCASECLSNEWITGKCHTDKHKIEFPEIPEYFREVLKQYRPKVSNRTPSQVLKSFDKGLDDDDDYDVNLVSLDQTTM